MILILISCGREELETKEINVDPITACFDFTVDSNNPQSVSFDAMCSENGTSYEWNFNNEGSSNEMNPSFTFETAGIKNVELTVSNDAHSETVQKDVQVNLLSSCINHSSYETISSDVTWKTGEVHCIKKQITISNGTLTIEPGVTLLFDYEGSIVIGISEPNSVLIAKGTIENPILFTSIQETPQPGDWPGILFEEGSTSESILEHCILEYGGVEYFIDEPKPLVKLQGGGFATLKNNTFRYSKGVALEIDYYSHLVDFSNNKIHDIDNYAIQMDPVNISGLGEGNQIDNKGILINNSTIKNDITWRKQTCPFFLFGIHNGSFDVIPTVSIEAGVELRFSLSQSLEVDRYKLLIEGTSSDPVILKAEDGDTWKGINFSETTVEGTSINHITIEDCENSIDSDHKAAIVVNSQNVSITNTTIKNSEGHGFLFNTPLTSFNNNSIENITGYPLYIKEANAINSIGENNQFSGLKPAYINHEDARSLELTTSTFWRKLNIPYLLNENLLVEYGWEEADSIRLEIEAGCEILFGEGTRLHIGAGGFVKFIATGTEENPIKFTSSKSEGKKAPGDWEGIYISSRTLEGSIMDHCIIEYGGEHHGNLDINSVKDNCFTLSNSSIKNSMNHGIYITTCNPTLMNNTFENNTLDNIYTLIY